MGRAVGVIVSRTGVARSVASEVTNVVLVIWNRLSQVCQGSVAHSAGHEGWTVVAAGLSLERSRPARWRANPPLLLIPSAAPPPPTLFARDDIHRWSHKQST